MTAPPTTSALLELMDPRFDEATPTRVAGTIAADVRHHQPWGIVHSGLYGAASRAFGLWSDTKR